MSANEVVVTIYELDTRRDRKTCISLDNKVDGANRKLAQWLVDHPQLSAPVVAKWLGCGETRIKELRRWATGGFVGSVSQRSTRQRFDREDRRHHADALLKSKEDFKDNVIEVVETVEDAAVVRKNILNSISDAKGVAEAYRKILKISSFDRATKIEISDAINLLIRKWRSVQSTLAAKGKAHGI
jgi:hypothetical protein